MKVTIFPSTAYGTIMAPPSKSMAHRFILCAGLSEGESIVENVDLSEDILATIDCLRALGAGVTITDPTKGPDKTEIQKGEGVTLLIHGKDLGKGLSPAMLPCRECGSTLRFFIPLCLLDKGFGRTRKVEGQENREPSVFEADAPCKSAPVIKMKLTGSSTLFKRPLHIYETICRQQGLFYEKGEKELLVGGRLSTGVYEIAGNVSSQFISGLLFALPLLEGESRIRLIPPVESRPYIEMTMQALDRFGIRTRWEDARTIYVEGGQHYQPQKVRVEGDYSNAAFFEALNLAGGNVTVEGLNEESLQGDKIYQEHFARLIRGFSDIDISDCPDLGPVLIAAAAMKHGARFTGTRRLKIKESDRGLAMKQELAKLSVDVDVRENEILVEGNTFSCPESASQPEPARNTLIELDGHNDHRIVMALSVLLTKTGGIIHGAEAVSKSLPDYFERLKKLGIGVKIYDELDK